MRGDERARHARRLAERPHVDDPVAAQAEVRERAAAVADDAEAVRVVDDQERVVPLRQRGKLGQRRQVAVHAEDRVAGDELARRRGRREAALELREVVVRDSGRASRATAALRR